MDAARPEQKQAGERGKLTIFFSFYSGTGKSYAMLREASRVRQEGTDVAVGLLSCDAWPETAVLAESFEELPCKIVRQDGKDVREIDLDACLERKPHLLLVDDLSHRNADCTRHVRRYQDISELLKAGIDVFTTLDVRHVESLQDTVSAILGDIAEERIPDRIFDRAARVEFIDIEPECLRLRLKRQGKAELLSACSPQQMSALREIALRRCADRAALSAGGARSQAEIRAHEHILVCLSSAPSNEKIIRTAARMAGAFQCGFTALYVETGEAQWMSQPDKDRLQFNIHLAQQLGASIETVYGDDVAYQIAEFSRLSGVTKIVLGRSGMSRRTFFRKPTLTERLIELTPELDIHIIPDSRADSRFALKHREAMHAPSVTPFDLIKSFLILLLATLVGFVFYELGFTEPNIMTLYILGVMLISIFTKSAICSFFASFVSVIAFNFFFTEPRFTLQVYDNGYPVTFLVMFFASLLTGSLAAKLKSHAKRSVQVAWRTKLLFETNQNLQKAGSRQEIVSITAKQLVKIFQRDIVAYRVEQSRLGQPELFLSETDASGAAYISEKERQVAQWVLTNNKRAGAGTETFSDARCIYFSVRAGDRVYSVVGMAASDKPLDSFESSILLSVLGESALAMENQANLEEKEAAAVLAKNEQLRADLLRSISHDLRTPLTSISGNASNLLSNGDLFDEKTKEQMYTDIYDDAIWLINLVENLLSVSRLEEGRMHLNLSTELIDEVVAESLRHVSRRSAGYHLKVQSGEEYLLAQIDAKLIVQVLINLIDNAIKYTPPGSEIDIRWHRRGDFIDISVADNGPGIDDQTKPYVFDMFFSAANKIADSRRSMGLGLALCKSIVNAHGGEITVADQSPHGAIFTFSVPAGEVELHE